MYNNGELKPYHWIERYHHFEPYSNMFHLLDYKHKLNKVKRIKYEMKMSPNNEKFDANRFTSLVYVELKEEHRSVNTQLSLILFTPRCWL